MKWLLLLIFFVGTSQSIALAVAIISARTSWGFLMRYGVRFK
jgi:hypothetical protein